MPCLLERFIADIPKMAIKKSVIFTPGFTSINNLAVLVNLRFSCSVNLTI